MIIALTLTAALTAGCATSDAPTIDPPRTDDSLADLNLSEVEQASIDPIQYTTYYSDATKTHVVGRCTWSICPEWPKGRHCTGTQTTYFTSWGDSCE